MTVLSIVYSSDNCDKAFLQLARHAQQRVRGTTRNCAAAPIASVTGRRALGNLHAESCLCFSLFGRSGGSSDAHWFAKIFQRYGRYEHVRTRIDRRISATKKLSSNTDY